MSGKTNTVGASYGKTFGAGGNSKNSANVNIGGSLSKGTQTTQTTTLTDTSQKGTNLTAGNNIAITSGADTTLVNTDVKAGGSVDVQAGGDVNLLAAADVHEVTQSTATTKTTSVTATVGVSANYDNGGASTDEAFTTGTLNTGITNTKSKTNTTETTTTDTTFKGTTIQSGTGTTVVASNDIAVENTQTTGDVLSSGDTVTAGGQLSQSTKEDIKGKTVTTTTSTSTSSTSIIKPDFKQAALDTVGNAVGEMGANQIGDLKENGTIDPVTHKLLHAANGAVVGAIKSGGTLDGAAAGAIGAAVGEITAEIVDDGTAIRDPKTGKLNEKGQELVKIANLAAQLAAGLAGTDATLTGAAAVNAVENNRLLHSIEISALEKKAEELVKTQGGTKEEWAKRLGNEALRQVDAQYARELTADDKALDILKTMDGYGDGFTDKLGNQLKFLAQDNQYS